jgi:hypothetical protein
VATVNITTNISPGFQDEPSNKNYLKPNSFRFIFNRLPNVEYFCQSTNLPKITLGAAMQPTPFVDIPHAGDKMEFAELNITFMVDENMINYIELYKWMIGLGFPKSHSQFAALVNDPTSRFSGSEKMLESSAYSDASLFILNSNNEPIVEVKFYNVFPVSLESLDFDLRIPTVDYFTGIATLRYTLYEILPINSTYDPNQ